MKIYQIYRKKNDVLQEERDVYIGYRMAETLAKDWIASQEHQRFPPTDYYIKVIDTNSKVTQDAT